MITNLPHKLVGRKVRISTYGSADRCVKLSSFQGWQLCIFKPEPDAIFSTGKTAKDQLIISQPVMEILVTDGQYDYSTGLTYKLIR